MNQLKFRPDFDVDKLLDELESKESVSTSSIPAQDEKPFPMPKLKRVSDITFSERPFQTPLSSMSTIGSRKDQYDDKNKEASKIPKPSKSLKPQGIGAGEWARYAIELINIEREKKYEYLESKSRDMDLSSKEALRTINQIKKKQKIGYLN